MPVARIFSRHPEHTIALSHDLERQGYHVEVLSPEEIPSTPADLEIQYEVYESETALQRARELAGQMQADVAVASGALGLEPPAVQAPSGTEMVTRNSSMGREGAEPTGKEEPELGSNLLTDYGLSQEEIGLEHDVNAVFAGASRQPMLEAAAERASLLGTWSERSLDALRAALESAITGIRWVAVHLVERTREQRQRYAIHSAEAKADRERRLLELTCQRAEAERRSQQLEAARRAAAGYLSELRRESAAARQEVIATSVKISGPARAPKIRMSVERVLARHTKAIAAGAAAAGLFFAVTLLSFSLRSRPAQSQAPVSRPPAAVAVQAATPAQNALAPRPSPAVRDLAKKQPLARASRSQSALRRSSAPQGQEDVADDVVVRHFSAPRNLQSRAINGVKHYSDTQN